MEDRDRFVDELLDSALAHQRAAEPRPGLEARILEHVRAIAGEQEAERSVWKLWVAAAATAAVVMAFVAIHVANRSQSPAVETPQAANAVLSTPPTEILTANSGAAPEAGAATALPKPTQIERSERKPLRRIEVQHWPSQFPTPAPLTAEEKALVRYVQETPPEVLAEPILKAKLTVQHVEIKPLEIPPLEIKPLNLGPAEEEIN